MKPKPYALKPWWPRAVEDVALSIGPLAMFRRHVAVAARRRGLPVAVQDFAVSSLAGLDVNSLRPDVGRQANEWVAQHQQLPRKLRQKPPRKLRNPLPQPLQKLRPQPPL